MQRPRRPPLSRGPGNSSGGIVSFVFRLVLLALFVSGVGYVTFFVVLAPPKNPPPGQAQAETDTGTSIVVPPPSKSVELATTASIQRQQLAVAKFKQKQLVGLFDEVNRTLDDWEKELLAWEKEGPALLTSEDGKRIATDPEQVKRYRGLKRLERGSSSDLATARKSAEELIGPVRESLKNPEDASTPASDIEGGLLNLRMNARSAGDSYRQATDAVRAMLAKVRGNAPGERSLEQAIAALDQEDAGQRIADIAAAEKKAKDEGAMKIAEEKARLAKETADAEAARIRDEAAKRKQESDLATARTIEEMKLRQKEGDQQISRLEDLAEQRRQGSLKAGTFWKGTVTSYGAPMSATMKITSRKKDDIDGVVSTAAGASLLNFTGTVDGTKLRLKRTTGETDRVEWVYQPATKTITGTLTTEGGQPMGTYEFRLIEEK